MWWGDACEVNTKKGHKLFFAIPFDSATRDQYKRISQRLRDSYPTITTVIGSNEIGPSQLYSEITTFKAQNRELHQQFTRQITDADILIADLTHNNPNVHVELGIALMQNKNILRVTGRSLSEAPFDVRQLEITTYRDEATLLGVITKYLDMFLKIKNLPFDSENAPFYSKPVQNCSMNGITPHPDSTAVLEASGDLVIRDGAIRAQFSFIRCMTRSDWFGVCFRVGDDTPWTGSHMVYVRQDGHVELATYPGPQVTKLFSAGGIRDGKQELAIDFENNFLRVQIEGIDHEISALTHQRAGRVVLAAHNAEVDVASAEIICRDTIEWDVP